MTVASASRDTIVAGSKITLAIYVVQAVFWGCIFAENIHMTLRLRRQPTEASKVVLANWKYWNQLLGLAVYIIAFGRNVMPLAMNGGGPFLIANE